MYKRRRNKIIRNNNNNNNNNDKIIIIILNKVCCVLCKYCDFSNSSRHVVCLWKKKPSKSNVYASYVRVCTSVQSSAYAVKMQIVAFAHTILMDPQFC